ncbi:NAD-dependent epimerase/dehydratase family protein [Acetobacterium sp.]|uniref:NAD-dependent epimerase/dehydratase family protein n=1 Tax=Acetobacterium sp. TaxID=1872094 RepID=UPI002F412B33
MKKILITGANSYIGSSFEKWVGNYPGQYLVDTVDMKDGAWKENDFSGYDVVFHAAGIAHVDVKKATEETKALYSKVNRDLTIETAVKAKNDGVKQFIFMSSIIVYGDSSQLNKKRVITKDTIPQPTNFYGNSKLQAEEGIRDFGSDEFKVVILRPPMIYGKGSKGNYPRLAKVAQKLPIFPDIDNQRSMLHIDNLCEFIRLMIENGEEGLFFPQNGEYVKTSEMVRMIAEAHGGKMRLVKVFNPMIRVISGEIGIFNKVFGNLVYEQGMSGYKKSYQINDLLSSIKETEG